MFPYLANATWRDLLAPLRQWLRSRQHAVAVVFDATNAMYPSLAFSVIVFDLTARRIFQHSQALPFLFPLFSLISAFGRSQKRVFSSNRRRLKMLSLVFDLRMEVAPAAIEVESESEGL